MQSRAVMSIAGQGGAERGTKRLARVLCVDSTHESATVSEFEWAMA